MNNTIKWTLIVGGSIIGGLTVFAIWNQHRKTVIDNTVVSPDDALNIINNVGANPPTYGVGDAVYNVLDGITQPVVNAVTTESNIVLQDLYAPNPTSTNGSNNNNIVLQDSF